MTRAELPSPLHPLEAPLPAELTGRNLGWLSAYRRHPVFSPAWARGRVRTGLALGGLFYLLLVAAAFTTSDDLRPLGGMVTLAAFLFVPLVAGPWAGVWVRRRGWPPRQEWAGLLAALVLVSAGSGLLQWTMGEPIRQWAAERTGTLDETGRPKRLQMIIGIHVTEVDSEGPPRRIDRRAEVAQARDAALTGFFLAGGFGLWGWVRERRALLDLHHERELARAETLRQQAEMRLSVLAAQVEPHFLFNTLAGVRSAIATDPGRASDLVDRLATYLRATIPQLREDGRTDSTVARQAEVVRAYLALMTARLPRLSVDIDVPAELAEARCPPLMLLSLVENAVKHGVELKIGPARIAFRVRRRDTEDGPMLELTVEDDGVGFGDAAAGGGIGLTNIREQLRHLYAGRGALELRNREGGGVQATLRLPLQFDHEPV